mgnify:CR=1 FL=1
MINTLSLCLRQATPHYRYRIVKSQHPQRKLPKRKMPKKFRPTRRIAKNGSPLHCVLGLQWNPTDAKKLSDDHRLTLASCREESYRLAGARSAAPTDDTRVNHVVSLAALDVLRQHRNVLLRSHPDGLSGLLRGSGLMFPKRSL